MSRVQVVDYDSNWPEVFEQIYSLVWPTVKSVALSLEHVGGTAVPGLAAKPIIDACIVARFRADVPRIIELLGEIGYNHRGNLGVEDREAFSQPDGLPRHHLYLSPQGSLSLKNHLGLRDYLRTHPEKVREFSILKMRLAQQFPDDIDGYIDGKTDFVLGVLEEIGLAEDELAAIGNINRTQ